MKKINKKGFTLIELLAVIIILALLIAIAVPAVTRYLNSARESTFAVNANYAIKAVKEYVTIEGMSGNNSLIDSNGNITIQTLNDNLLDKKLEESPYGYDYQQTSYVHVGTDLDGNYVYSICLLDTSGRGLYDKTTKYVKESKVTKDNISKYSMGTECN